MKWINKSVVLSDELSRLSGMEPHELLSIASNSCLDEVKNAYRKMIMTYHPDKSDSFMKNHNEQVTKLINLAYEKMKMKIEGK